MAVSGTYNFNPTIGSIALNAFSRIGVKRTEILPQHMEDSYMETNLMQADWAADGLTVWTVELISVPLVAGVGTYTIPSNVVTILDMYISNGTFNRLITGMSRTDYASLAEPNEIGYPTVFWQDRLISQTFTLWPKPDGNESYAANYYAYTRIPDADARQGGNATIPYWWLDAWTAGLAYRLSRHYAPELEAVRKVDAAEAYARACKQAEAVPMYITPGMMGYFRN